MSFTAPLGLLALLAVPVIVALHRFRNRLPEQRVAGLFLFPGTAVASPGGRKVTRLWQSRSLWLECTAAVLFALWLAGVTVGDLLPRHLVVVVDNSASMGAVTTHERVEACLQRLAQELARHDEVTVISSGVPAQVAVGPRARAEQLQAFARSYQPSLPNHSLQVALDLAREIAGNSGEIVCITDAELADPGLDLHLVACGQAAGNAAVASLQRVRGDNLDRLLVKIVGFGDVAAGEVVVFSGEQELARLPLQLSGATGTMQFTVPVAQDLGLVHVQLPADALLLDNDAWLVAEPEPIVAVCNLLPAAASTEFELPRMLAAMAGWRDEPDERRAQLVLREARQTQAQSAAPDQLELMLGMSAGAPQAHRSPFVMDRSHPLLSGVELQGVAWQSGSGELPGQVLVASGSKVLLSLQQTEQGQRIWCDATGTAGNLVRAPDWPILFANALDQARRAVPGCQATNLSVGDELQYRGGRLRQALTLLDPDGGVVTTAIGDLTSTVLRPGCYRIVTKQAEELATVAVRFVDARESDLRRTQQLDRVASAASRSALASRSDAGPARRVLLALLLLVVALNWWLLPRSTP